MMKIFVLCLACFFGISGLWLAWINLHLVGGGESEAEIMYNGLMARYKNMGKITGRVVLADKCRSLP
ncbi:hypothetical protein QL992_06195 [Microbacterium sp. APC 3898]|uniref:Uncharacterized protein n=2 Tax=Planococcus TaxID=1372 RepID=A0ABT7ZMX9_9BACL|nr:MULTISPECIES: hypothetical protein [Terrabacteria group]MBD8016098.1 hypothetical protein [Planococcus wigleyi]MDN3428501.1 hypothetical protein [Planococcus sp. APC 4016]MDN3438449.1 hypothetical protein [Planococcus sp. APC 3900]MDN3498792.1 hypothetical protein [Microbacterium sp. APC 3898]